MVIEIRKELYCYANISISYIKYIQKGNSCQNEIMMDITAGEDDPPVIFDRF